MSTKNIARTAIEGGRAKDNKHERWQSNRLERKATRRLMRRVSCDPEYLNGVCFPQRLPIRKEFADKLSAPQRWLATHGIGKSAEEIRGLLLTRFDTRSLAGRHLVFDHLMPRRHRTEWSVSAGGNGDDVDFDTNGILRHNPKRAPYHWGSSRWIRAIRWKETVPADWRVGYVDGAPFWFFPTNAFRVVHGAMKIIYRCDRPLTEKESDHYWALRPYDRKRLRFSKALRHIADLS